MNEDDFQNGKGNHTQAGSQSVDAVNQVDSIGNEYRQQHGQGNSYTCGNFIDSEKSVEIVDIESRQWKECGRDDLHKEFLAVSHSHKIIGNTDDIQQGKPGDKEEQLGYHGHGELRIGEISYQDTQGGEKTGGAEDDGEERNSSQSWNGPLMDLPGIGRIEEPFA